MYLISLKRFSEERLSGKSVLHYPELAAALAGGFRPGPAAWLLGRAIGAAQPRSAPGRSVSSSPPATLTAPGAARLQASSAVGRQGGLFVGQSRIVRLLASVQGSSKESF